MPAIQLLAYDRSPEMRVRCRDRLARFGARSETLRIAIEDGAWRLHRSALATNDDGQSFAFDI